MSSLPRSTKPPPSPAARSPSGLSLLVIGPTSTFSTPLPVTGELRIGRGDDVEVRVDDTRMSRVHAIVSVGDRVEVRDNGSMNGSSFGDRPMEPHVPMELSVGQAIVVGRTTIVLQRASLRLRALRLVAPAQLGRAVDAACARADPRCALIVVRLSSRGSLEALRISTTGNVFADDVARVGALEATLAAVLDEGDVAAAYGDGLFGALAEEISPADGRARCEQLTKMFDAAGLAADAVVVTCPRDGRDHATLRFVALRALDALAATIAARSPASGPIVGAAMARLDPVVGRVASGSINVLILGETGVGKEIMARAIHERSPRASAPMVCLNCAALSESLLESELFGHEKGAFTGATQSKPGLLEAAQGGTVFLDEIGEMPMGLQAKMLRVLEQREVLRIGALKPRAIDVRFVSATHRDPAREIEAGRLRQDLYFRLNGVTIEIPPLRSRVDEIEPLARAFLESACRQLGRAPAPRIAREVAAALIAHPWPGNIRELRNTMERAVLLCEGDVIGFDHVQLQAVAAAARLHPSIGEVTSPITGASPMRDDAERARILDALDKTHWNQTRAAELLGMSRRTLVTRLGDYQLPRPRKRGDGP